MSDFNINNYSDEELYDLLDLEKDASADEIREKVNEYTEKYINEDKGEGVQYYNFFIEVQERLLEEEEEDEGGDFIKTEYHPNPTNTKELPNRMDSTVVVNDEHAVLRRERLPIRQGHSVPYVQGQMNPTLQNVKKQLINIDSHYRKGMICHPYCENPHSSHLDGHTLDVSGVDVSGEFVFDAGIKIYIDIATTTLTGGWINSTQTQLIFFNIHAPFLNSNTWYIVSGSQGSTDEFFVPWPPLWYYAQSPAEAFPPKDGWTNGGATAPILIYTLPPGMPCQPFFNLADSPTDFTFNLSQPIHHVLKMSVYSYEIPHSWYVFSPDYGTTTFGVSGECVDISAGNYDPSGLADAINAALTSGVTISYNPITNKVTFHGTGVFDLVFYDTSGTHFDCSAAPCGGLPGGKLDYNLGWLLGFRQPSYSGSSSYTGEALVDTYGFRYLFLEINDFHNNRLNQSVISMDANRSTFRYPASKRRGCDVTENPPATTSCGKPPPPWTGPALTASEVYTRAQIELAQQEGFPDRYLSPVNSDIIARIPVRKTNNYDMLFDNWNNNLEDTAREYFGPVTLKRLHVRLLNDKGFPINLNGMDFSFSLIVKYLYQY